LRDREGKVKFSAVVLITLAILSHQGRSLIGSDSISRAGQLTSRGGDGNWHVDTGLEGAGK